MDVLPSVLYFIQLSKFIEATGLQQTVLAEAATGVTPSWISPQQSTVYVQYYHVKIYIMYI